MLLLEQFNTLSLNPASATRLKELVLQLAVQGKLTEAWRKENPDVEPAAELLKKIEAEKEQLIKKKKIKKEHPFPKIEEKEISFNLPETWEWCRLGDISSLINGDRGKNYPSKDHYVAEGIPFISAGNLLNNQLDFFNLNYISPDRYNLLNSGKIQDKDILYCLRGSLGKSAIVENIEEGAIASSLVILRLFMPLVHKYVLNYLSSPFGLSLIKEFDNGSAQPNLSANNVKKYIFPMPPLAEQEAIVTRVEELFKNIEVLQEKTAKRIKLKKQLGTAALQNLITATTENLPQNWQFLKENFITIFNEAVIVKKLRETIFQLAVQGKLTQAWRHQNPNPEPASELLKRIQAEKAQLVKEKKIKKELPLEPIDEVSVAYELPDGWEWVRLGEITNYGSSDKVEPNQADENLWVLELEDVEKSTSRLIKKVRYKERNFQSTKNKFFKGDIIYGKLRPYLDKVIVADEAGVCTTEMIPFRGYVNINPLYLRLLLKNESFIKYANDSTHGMNLPRLGTDKARAAIVQLAPLTEQEAIIAKVDELMQLCDELENHIEQSKQQTEVLMQAVVQEALQPEAKEVEILN